MKKFEKGKTEPNAAAPAFQGRPNFFRGNKFGGGKNMNQPKFNPGTFKTQHKG